MKTDDELRAWIRELCALRCDPRAYEPLAVKALIDVLGDLSLHEIRRLRDMAIADRTSGQQASETRSTKCERPQPRKQETEVRRRPAQAFFRRSTKTLDPAAIPS